MGPVSAFQLFGPIREKDIVLNSMEISYSQVGDVPNHLS